jgi:hypothetical protein
VREYYKGKDAGYVHEALGGERMISILDLVVIACLWGIAYINLNIAEIGE